MHPAELAARAIQRAKDEHIHIRATDRVGVYTTCSRSEPGTAHPRRPRRRHRVQLPGLRIPPELQAR